MADTTQSTDATGYVLCDDMIVSSRIARTAQALGLKMKPARSMAALQALITGHWPNCIIVDLANPSLDLVELLGFLKESGTNGPQVIAYGSHFDTANLQHALDAGCVCVLSRTSTWY